MAEAALCAGCFRDNEEEKAEFWCCDCGELVCHACGKAHRRFAPPHDVVRLDEISEFRREVPTECLLHDKKKLILFCVGHDKLICHECLIKEHSDCKIVMEVAKAAKGVKHGSAITELKRGMEKTKELIAKYKNGHQQQQGVLIDNEKTSMENIKKIQNEISGRFEEIKKITAEKYQKSKEEMSHQLKKMEQIEQRMKENLKNICQFEGHEGGTSEVHIFLTVKYLEGTLRKGQEELNNIVRNKSQSLDVFSGDFKKQVDTFFESLNPKKQIIKDKPSAPRTFVSEAMSQVKATRHVEVPAVANELVPLKKSEIIASYYVSQRISFTCEKVISCCFIDEKQLLVLVSFTEIDQISKHNEKCVSPFRKIGGSFSPAHGPYFTEKHQKSNDRSVLLFRKIDVNSSRSPTESPFIKLKSFLDMNISSTVAMYDERFSLVAINTTIVVVDHVELRQRRSIEVSEQIIWLQVINQNIYIIVDTSEELNVCTVDFYGNLTNKISLPQNIASVDIENRYLYASHVDNNSITGICLPVANQTTLYESIDLQNACLLQCLSDGEVILLEKSSGIMYKLNTNRKTRAVLLKGVCSAIGLRTNATRKLLAVTKPREIEIYKAVVSKKNK